MSRARMGLVLLWGAPALYPGALLSAQDGGLCLRPLLPPASIGLEAPESDSGPEDPGFFLAPDGRLCQRFLQENPGGERPQTIEERTPTPGRAFLLSAAIPGLGQKKLGQNRWVGYVAVELWAWIQYFGKRREGRALQKRYKDLAWFVARRVSVGPRVDGDFEYYEAMTQYGASGAYDTRPEELGVQPEEDPETFNGSVWALAREIFFLDDPGGPSDPGSDHYQKALRYYMSRAYEPPQAWNWTDNVLQQAEFSELIRLSDENLRRGTTMVGVIIANHLLSSVDALVTGRLLQARASEPLVGLSLIPGPFYQDALALSVRIPTR
ncbi:MAG: hypothetical protein ACWGSQ_11310 [Longimicrobiales bacterium]